MTGTSPHYVVAAGDGTLFVADEAGHDVAVVRAGRVVARLPDAVMPGGMAIASPPCASRIPSRSTRAP